MKYMLLLTVFSLFIINIYGQNKSENAKIEQEIRRLEKVQTDALLRNDVDGMQKQWAKDYTVNNPLNNVVKASEGPIRAGTRIYSSFERNIESILIHGETVIVMGSETVVPKGNSPDSGETIRRRFTNIWRNENGQWLMIGRHANVICKE